MCNCVSQEPLLFDFRTAVGLPGIESVGDIQANLDTLKTTIDGYQV
jgi:hypothetical protein